MHPVSVAFAFDREIIVPRVKEHPLALDALGASYVIFSTGAPADHYFLIVRRSFNWLPSAHNHPINQAINAQKGNEARTAIAMPMIACRPSLE